MSIAVFDVDGVVADVRHRLHYIERRPKNWAGFFLAAKNDPPVREGLALAAELAQRHEIVWLTGRPGWLRDITETWLRSHDLPGNELRMRGDHDHRPARLFKLADLGGLAPRTIAAFVDDDVEVVAAATEAGFRAVLADWLPQAETLRDAQERLGRS
jgi:hypothetical protein